MRVLHRVAQLQEQRDPLAHAAAMAFAPCAQAFARHVFHRQPRRAVRQFAAVEDAADVRMPQLRQDPAFLRKTLTAAVVDREARHDLDRDPLLEIAAAFGQIHHAHAAPADLTHQPERTDVADVADRIGQLGGQHAARGVGAVGFVDRQQPPQARGQRRMRPVQFDQSLRLGLGLQFAQGLEQLRLVDGAFFPGAALRGLFLPGALNHPRRAPRRSDRSARPVRTGNDGSRSRATAPSLRRSVRWSIRRRI